MPGVRSLAVRFGGLLPRFVRKWIVLREARKQLHKAGVPEEQVEVIMTGWKTWAGGIAAIAGGVALIASTVASGEFDMKSIAEGAAMIAGGMAAIGIGHKLEKTAGK